MKLTTLWAALKQAVKEVGADDVAGLSAELAYRFFLAIFPFFIFLAALGGIVAGALNIQNPAERLVKLIGDQLPSDAASVLETQLRGVIETQNPGLLSFGIIAAIWAASSGFKAVMKAMNRAYDVEETRSFVMKNLVGVGLTVLTGGFAVGAFALVVAGQFLGGRQRTHSASTAPGRRSSPTVDGRRRCSSSSPWLSSTGRRRTSACRSSGSPPARSSSRSCG